MTKKSQLMDAIGGMLSTALGAGSEVAYWRDIPPVRDSDKVYAVYRDIGAQFSKVGAEHEHRVRVEIEVIQFASTNFGNKMNEALDALIKAIGLDPSLGQPRTVVELVSCSFDSVGDGHQVFEVNLQLDVVYRTKVWEGV